VFLLLGGMSLASWIGDHRQGTRPAPAPRQARFTESFWHAPDFADRLNKLGTDENPFRALALEGRDASAHHTPRHPGAAARRLGASDWLTRSLRNCIDEATANLQSGLAVLASVGSTAPFVGLFGTVWGIYHALMAIGVAGQATIDKVAGPIGEALIMTALGLAVAIPAVLGYNALVRGNKNVLAQAQSLRPRPACLLRDRCAREAASAKGRAMKKGNADAMAFGTQDDADEVMNEINMTPLVDVMLVLLIIFIITVPVMKHAVNIDLPRASSHRGRREAAHHPPERRCPGQLLLERGAHRRLRARWAPAGRSRAHAAARAAHPRRQGRALREGGARPWPPRNRPACARSASSQ
jgi:biopolymer transport protein ExbB